MEMKYYNPSNNFRAPIPREPKPYKPPQGPSVNPVIIEENSSETEIDNKKEQLQEQMHLQKNRNFLHQLSQDDMIILGVLFLLLLNSCDDYLLLLALGYLFLSGKREKA